MAAAVPLEAKWNELSSQLLQWSKQRKGIKAKNNLRRCALGGMKVNHVLLVSALVRIIAATIKKGIGLPLANQPLIPGEPSTIM